MDSHSNISGTDEPVAGPTASGVKRTVEIKGIVYPLDLEGCVDLTGKRIPNVSLGELPEDIIYQLFSKFFTIRVEPVEKNNVHFWAYGEFSTNRSIMSLWTIGRIISLAIRSAKRRNRSIRVISEKPSDYILSPGFTAHIEGKTLSELFKSAVRLETEILSPVYECEKIVFAFVKSMKGK